MKFLMVPYVLIACLFSFFGAIHANDVDENNCFKVNWRIMVFFGMMTLSPIAAKLFGLF